MESTARPTAGLPLLLLTLSGLLLAGCPVPNYFAIVDGNDQPVFRIDHAGNVDILGELVENAEPESDELSEHAGVPEFLVMDAEGTIVARVDSETGDVFLMGELIQTPELTATEDGEFQVTDSEGVVQVLIDQQGNLKYRGEARMTLWRSVSSTVYHPCGTIDVTLTVHYPFGASVMALGIEEALPSGWTFVELVTYSEQPDIAPDAGDTMLEFAWVDVPAFPVTVTYRAQVPANASGDQTILGSALYRRDGPELRSPVVYTTLEEGEGLEGDCGEGEQLRGSEGETEGQEGETEGEEPCVHDPCGYHSGDTTKSREIELTELLRVIQFYNSGGFHCADPPDSTEDGYEPCPGANVSCCPHDSDYSPDGPDWRIKLTELLRFIQFYNSAGYAPAAGTEDGYTPGLFRIYPLPEGPDYASAVSPTFDLKCTLNQDQIFSSRVDFDMFEMWLERTNPQCDWRTFRVYRASWANVGGTADTFYVTLVDNQNVRTLNPRPEVENMGDFRHFCPMTGYAHEQFKTVVYTDMDNPSNPDVLTVRFSCSGTTYEPTKMYIDEFVD